ncbi:MAG: relaxase domain-containing protein [Vicinamibacterales bacterium]
MYRSELDSRLTALGYDIERGRSGQPEIRGYTREYLDASSPRRQQIEDYLAEADRQGAAAAQIAAHQTREASWMCRMRRCSGTTRISPTVSVTSRRTSLKPRTTVAPTLLSTSVSTLMPRGGP